MAAGRKQVNAHVPHAHRDLSICLDSVCVKQDAVIVCDLSDSGNRLYCADFIVCKHHGDQHRLFPDCPLYILRIDKPFLVRLNERDLRPLFLQPLTGVQDSVMLNCRRDDMRRSVSAFVQRQFKHTLERPVVRLASSGCKKDFVPVRPDQICNCLSGPHDCTAADLSCLIHSRSIAIGFCQKRQHGRDCLGQHPCCCRIVQIDEFRFIPAHLFPPAAQPGSSSG